MNDEELVFKLEDPTEQEKKELEEMKHRLDWHYHTDDKELNGKEKEKAKKRTIEEITKAINDEVTAEFVILDERRIGDSGMYYSGDVNQIIDMAFTLIVNAAYDGLNRPRGFEFDLIADNMRKELDRTLEGMGFDK